MSEPSILSFHTPTTSFAIIHSLTQESLDALYDKLSRKLGNHRRVCSGWLKYEYNGSVWNLDDDSDYAIFVWRQQQSRSSVGEPSNGLVASSSSVSTNLDQSHEAPTLQLRDPTESLPSGNAYCNPSFYLFRPSVSRSLSNSPRPKSVKSHRTKGSRRSVSVLETEDDGIPQFKKEFAKFHGENGVRTVLGSIGPVQNVRMLLKSGYRHVYVSRKFATEHGFIPADATLGSYGYGGLVNIGEWPITLNSSSSSHNLSTPTTDSSPRTASPGLLPNGYSNGAIDRKSKKTNGETGSKVTNITVYLAEEPHFDVVLGRSFFERRKIRTNPIDATDVVCMDTGEKVECELVILKDGRGEIVTVT